MLPFMTKRKVMLDKPDFSKLLSEGRILMDELTVPPPPPPRQCVSPRVYGYRHKITRDT